MNDKTKEELKPCPFCGGNDLSLMAGNVTGKYHKILCYDCNAVIASSTRQAWQAWNTRAYEPELTQLREENERLKAMLLELSNWPQLCIGGDCWQGQLGEALHALATKGEFD